MENYDFVGYHLLANYTDCNETAISDTKSLREAMISAAKASGATILDMTQHCFPNSGFSMLILLSESHASIHTYPEVNSCFVDIFTCGTTCNPEAFHQSLIEYLKPKKTTRDIMLREGQKISSISKGC